jgi:hypothetical protein
MFINLKNAIARMRWCILPAHIHSQIRLELIKKVMMPLREEVEAEARRRNW